MDKLDKIISIVHSWKEDMSAGAIANVGNNPSGPITIAGLPPDMPPVDLRKKRNWNPFFKNLARVQRRKPSKM